MKIDSSIYRVPEGTQVKLRKWATLGKPVYSSKRQYRKLLKEHIEQLNSLQEVHYASGRYALLLIFQAMDTAGKDGAIRHVMSGVNPQGCQVHSLKEPSATELRHDFLWRTTCALPERGFFGIFNRSYYEEVLIARVHPHLLGAEGVGTETSEANDFWDGRYDSIVDLEEHLHRNGTRIVKFFLHLSKEEQRKRFLARIDEPQKNWKFSMVDVKERGFWKDYMHAYERCISATSTRNAPWYIVPADDKVNARLIVSQVILDTLRAFGETYPEIDAQRRRELHAVRRRLVKSKAG
jgi:PPK2 family polyphosphate:nucleotide phosphotransferase